MWRERWKEHLWVLWRGFDRRSLAFLAALGVVYGLVALFNPWLIDPHAEWDILLGCIWVTMTAALVWRPDLSRDWKMAVVGLGGGLVIEGWGTNTLLWSYWTAERPPLWILPAWPIAGLCIDRLSRGVNRLAPWMGQRFAPAYWVILPAFVLLFTRLMKPAITHPWTIGVLVLMGVVIVVRPKPKLVLVLFVTGATLGIFLEYWGTSRHCWTYWTRQVPPIEAVLAHGFAAVSFARGVQLVNAIVSRIAWRPAGWLERIRRS